MNPNEIAEIVCWGGVAFAVLWLALNYWGKVKK
jgi:hypothetical protein